MKRKLADDLVEAFVKDRLLPTTSRNRLRSRHIYKEFQSWCKDKNINHYRFISTLPTFARTLSHFVSGSILNGYLEYNCQIRKPSKPLSKEFYL